MTSTVLATAGLLVLALALWAGHRTLTHRGESRSAGMVDGLGNFIDVFDPSRARADRDLREQESKTEVAPSPDDDWPVRVDLREGTAVVRRQAKRGRDR